MTNITVSASGLSRRYGTRVAVHDLGFELRQGEVLGLLGPNGAGKSTTLQMLAGCLAPSSGGIEICGIDLLEQPREAKSLLGYLPETPPLYQELTVNEFLRFAARLHRVAKTAIPAAVESAKQRCGLAEAGKRLVGSLSKGYQQRVGIAQAIVHNPRVVILDEPTSGLDPIQIREIRKLIRELGGEHSVILSTHILPDVESICDRVQIMNQGRLAFAGSMAELKQAHPEQAGLEEVFIHLTRQENL
ncbi:MAG: ABC transporter ATP-binding protein [Sulfuricella sp.]|nr:ABC transporter ATP-binding protein [Sulfuricella sp.]